MVSFNGPGLIHPIIIRNPCTPELLEIFLQFHIGIESNAESASSLLFATEMESIPESLAGKTHFDAINDEGHDPKGAIFFKLGVDTLGSRKVLFSEVSKMTIGFYKNLSARI